MIPNFVSQISVKDKKDEELTDLERMNKKILLDYSNSD